MRVGGRIKNALVDQDCKHPIIMPHQSPVSMLIVRDIHNIAHLGTEWMISQVRMKFWITKVRHVTSKVRRDCVTCKRLYALPCDQRMADLPPERVLAGEAPFTFVGTDCFGPVITKRGRSEIKRYGCIFTCFATRAVHVEVLCSLDTDSMINGIRRFIARRGVPSKIWSDNGTNYIGCKNELSRALKEIDNDKMNVFCAKREIEWVLNPRHAPHMGGVFERMIQTVKRVFHAMLAPGRCRLNDETLQTLMCEVESIVNTRPITRCSNDVNDPSPLSPNHLLLMRGVENISPGQFTEADMYRRRWRHVQHMANEFWRRWTREYLVLLQKSRKWHEAKRNLKENDLVMIVEESTPRGLWPLGVVVGVKRSQDGLVRTVDVRTKCTRLTRPISKIVFLEGDL